MTPAPADILDGRRQALGRHLRQAGVDALLITSRSNIAYLSQFFGTSGFLIASADQLTLVSDARYQGVLTELSRQVPALALEIVLPGGGSVEERLAGPAQQRGRPRPWRWRCEAAARPRRGAGPERSATLPTRASAPRPRCPRCRATRQGATGYTVCVPKPSAENPDRAKETGQPDSPPDLKRELEHLDQLRADFDRELEASEATGDLDRVFELKKEI